LLIGGLGIGGWRHYQAELEAAATAQRIKSFVPEVRVAAVDAVVHVPEIPNRSFPGTVTRIASALQPGSRTLLTEVDVPNPDGALSPGVYGTVELFIQRKTPSMIIPADAVVMLLRAGSAAIRRSSISTPVLHLDLRCRTIII
jgi:multidrug efflux pump subunit AcrA (membrane-fusion protein)